MMMPDSNNHNTVLQNQGGHAYGTICRAQATSPNVQRSGKDKYLQRIEGDDTRGPIPP
jgi:hypothetical protein